MLESSLESKVPTCPQVGGNMGRAWLRRERGRSLERKELSLEVEGRFAGSRQEREWSGLIS